MILLSELRKIQTIQGRLHTGDIATTDRLDAATLAYLEHPTDPADRGRFLRFLTLATTSGAVPSRTFRVYPDGSEEEVTETAPRVRPCPPPTALPYRQAVIFPPVGKTLITRCDYRRWREKCPPSLLSEMTLIDRWLEKPPKPPRPTVPSRDIKARLQAGESIEAIRTATGASKHAIRAVKRANGIPDCPPGPKPR